MRAILTSFGSTGDVEPLLALASELRSARHSPVLALPPYFAERVRSSGIAYVPLAAAFDAGILRRVGTDQIGMTDAAAQVKRFLDLTIPAVASMVAELRALCRGADVLISTPFQLASRIVHELTRIPFVSVHLSQFAMASSRAIWAVSAKPINDCRRRFGLSDLHDPLGADAASPHLALYAISTTVLRRPMHWPLHHAVVGFFFSNEENWLAPDELRCFLSDGPPPLMITFGSVAHSARDAERLTLLVLEAVEKVGRRTIIQPGVGGMGNGVVHKLVHVAGFVPHSWLLTRVACVVHHGGAGTTAATLRAGVPTVVIPHTLDQPIWAALTRALKCTAGVTPYVSLTADWLATVVSDALQNPIYRQAAAVIAERVRSEGGVQRARLLIEQYLERAPT